MPLTARECITMTTRKNQTMNEPVASNDSLDYERIGRFIYSFHRVCGSTEALKEVSLTTGVPQEIAGRAHNLATIFDRVVKNPGSMTESDIDSILREATDTQSAIDVWRISNSMS